MAKVRTASMQDMPALLAMCNCMHAESPRYSSLSYSEEKMFNVIAGIIENRLRGQVFVAENNTDIIGMLGFVVTEHFFSHDTVAGDLGIYVRPEYRGSSAFVKLVSAFEITADAMGVSEKTLGISTGLNAEGMASVLERLGYTRCGISLLKKGREECATHRQSATLV